MATIQTAAAMQDNISGVLYGILNSVEIAAGAFEGLQQTVNSPVNVSGYMNLTNAVDTTGEGINENTEEQGNFSRMVEQSSGAANKLAETIKGAITHYVNLDNITAALKLSDQITSSAAKLNLMNDGLQTTEELQNMIFNSAERSGSSYQAMTAAITNMGNAAGDAFSGNEEMIAFTEQANKQFAIAGLDSAGTEAAMPVLTEAMGSGAMDSEQYNSLLAQAPNMIQTIADYMDVPQSKLRDMAAQGQITSDVIKASMFSAADSTNAKFESMPKTFSQIWTSFQNNALMAFQPVLERLNEFANSEAFQSFVNGVTEALYFAGDIISWVLDLVMQAGTAIADNWSWISPIVYGVAAAFMVYYGWLLLVKGAEMAAAAASGIMTAFKLMMSAATMLLTGATWKEATAQMGLNSAMYACPLVWIIILIIALIAIFYAAVAAINHFAGTSISATGVICGVFMTALAFIGNLFIALWNLVVDVFVLIYNLIATVANFIGNVFSDPVGAVARLFFDLADTVLGVIEAIANAIDTVFGSDLASSVQGWRNDLGGWVDSKFGRGEEVMEKLDPNKMKLDRFEYGEAYNSGYKFGEGIDKQISNFDPKKLLSKDSDEFDDYYKKKSREMDKYNGMNNSAGSYVPAATGGYNGYNGVNGLGGIGNDVSNISGNTGAIANSMDITSEDLKYLRDLAERDVINRFTTASVTINQTNSNNISKDVDLDGVVTGLTDAMSEAVGMVAEGVHI